MPWERSHTYDVLVAILTLNYSLSIAAVTFQYGVVLDSHRSPFHPVTFQLPIHLMLTKICSPRGGVNTREPPMTEREQPNPRP